MLFLFLSKSGAAATYEVRYLCPLCNWFCKERKLVALHLLVQLCPSHQTPLAGPAAQNPPTLMV